MIRVLIADDHPIVREGLRRLLGGRTDLTITGEACSGADVVELLSTWPCDVAVLDLSMPDLQGLELVRLVRERWPKVAIVIFTMQREDVLGRSLVKAGIFAYVRKTSPPGELVTAVRRAAQGLHTLSAALTEAPASPTGSSAPHSLFSAREAQVFLRLCNGISVKDIASELEISASTASNHIARVREKLGVRTNGEVMLYALQHGLLEGS